MEVAGVALSLCRSLARSLLARLPARLPVPCPPSLPELTLNASRAIFRTAAAIRVGEGTTVRRKSVSRAVPVTAPARWDTCWYSK
jgi:hypothetical protein